MRDDRQRGRDHAEPQSSRDAFVERFDAAAQVLDFGEHAVGVFERQLALRRQAEIAVAALDDRRAEFLFELADRRREGGLRHMARFRRAAEVALAGERHEIFELSEHHVANLAVAPSLSTSGWRGPAAGFM